jgi:dihydropyrimidinase
MKKTEAKNFSEAPFGAPGVETILPLMYSDGVARGRITLNRLVQLICENPAKRFGVYPRKGSFEPGADADLTIIDPSARWTIRGSGMRSRAGYTGYEGWHVSGKPVKTLRQGNVLLDKDTLKAGTSAAFLKPV